jgi:2,4-dienoyl-CoA reductase-like NADH-dependent reductase (Old Yellow Enzyme family)
MPTLFSPLTLGSLEVPNRIFMARSRVAAQRQAMSRAI